MSLEFKPGYIERNCKQCGRQFWVSVRNSQEGRGIYCTNKCVAKRNVRTYYAPFESLSAKAENGCHIWLGTLSVGYGLTRDPRNGRRISAHRLSYELAFGPIPQKLLVCHRCDIPACVNPEHLFLGTHKENTADMISKGRAKHPPMFGTAIGTAKLTVDAVRNIRVATGRYKDIANAFGISQSQAFRIKNRMSWKHVV